MKQRKIWILGVLLLSLSGCQWEEEPTLAELYAGTYRGKLEVLSPLEGMPTNGQVDMVVAGDRELRLKFINMELADKTIDTLVIPALLSLDGQNRLTGKRQGIPWTGEKLADAELEGKLVYGKSELTVYMNVGMGAATPEVQWVVKFQGTRK